MKKKEEGNNIQGALPAGTVLKERYTIEKVLGRGGFGITYKAVDESLQIVVAIKEYVSEKIVKEERGRKEAQIAATFYDLEGVVSIRDYFTENKTSYIVMDYVKGISVRNYIKQQGRMNGKDVLEQMRPILKAMTKIHESGVVHRDISADNMMITREGRLLLIDFGAASINRGEKDVNTVIFKRGFAPIEQYRQEGKIGPWTDVYALCATIYFMITGMVPEDAMERWINDTCKPLDNIMGTGLSQSESKAIMKGIEVEAGKRFQTVEQLYNELYKDVKNDEKNVVFFTEKPDEKTHEGTKTLREEIRKFFSSEKNTPSNNSNETKISNKKYYVIIVFMIIAVIFGIILWITNDVRDRDASSVATPKPITTQIPEETKKPEPVATTKAQEETEVTAKPVVTKKPAETEKTETTKKPKVTKKPKSIKKPKVTDKPKATKKSENNSGSIEKSTNNEKQYDTDLDLLL